MAYKYILDSDLYGARELASEPIGWDDMGIELDRDSDLHGITWIYSAQLKFTKDGKEYIDKMYQEFGIEAKVNITIKKYNSRTNQYDIYFPGKINFEVYKSDDIYAVCNIEQDGFVQKFKNRLDTDVNLLKRKTLSGNTIYPFPDETIELTMHSQVIDKKYEAFSNQEIYVALGGIVPDAGNRHSTIVLGFEDVKFKELEKIYTYTSGFSTDLNVFEIYEAIENVEAKIEFKLDTNLQVILNDGDYDYVRYTLYFRKNDDTPIQLAQHIDSNVGGSYNHDLNVPVTNYDLSLVPGDKIYLYGDLSIEDVAGSYDFEARFLLKTTSYIKITGKTQTEETTANAMLVHEFFTRIFQVITDEASPFYSSLYGRTDSAVQTYEQDGEASMRAVAGGFQVRGFPIEDKPIFANAKDAIKSFQAIDNIGVGIEVIDGKQKVVIEKLDYFYDASKTIYNIPFVSNIETSVAKEYYYNEVEIGYEKWENELPGGLDEFNTKRLWSLPITVIKRRLSQLSKYRAGGYDIEATRRQRYSETSTTDWKSDNDNFIICVRRNGELFMTEKDEDFVNVLGVMDAATTYNLKIHPKRNLLRWGNVIKAAAYKQWENYMKFAYGDANYKMSTQLLTESDPVVENEDVLLSDLPDPLWVPEFVTFTAKCTRQNIEKLMEAPKGVIGYSRTDTDFKKGFVINVKINSQDNEAQYKLLKAYGS